PSAADDSTAGAVAGIIAGAPERGVPPTRGVFASNAGGSPGEALSRGGVFGGGGGIFFRAAFGLPRWAPEPRHPGRGILEWTEGNRIGSTPLDLRARHRHRFRAPQCQPVFGDSPLRARSLSHDDRGGVGEAKPRSWNGAATSARAGQSGVMLGALGA